MTALILASGSETRRDILARAGLDFRVEIPRIDEEALKASLVQEGATPPQLVQALAEAKALSVSALEPEAVVIAGDQILVKEGTLISKPADRAEARATLKRLSGKSHELITSVVLVRGGSVVWRSRDQAQMDMHILSDVEIDRYLDRVGDACLSSVGAYQLEGLGATLFARVSGDYFTILGLPLLSLLAQLRHMRLIG